MSQDLSFRRTIGLFGAVMIGIGAMMGPGIFALPGEVARLVGPLGIGVYLLVGVVTLLTALSYSELGAAIPIAGGGYSFTSRTLPRPLAFLTGWFFWIGNTLACAMYAVIFAITIRGYFWPHASLAVIALTTTLVFAAVNFFGGSEAIRIITVMNLVELAVLVGIAALGLSHVSAPNLRPLAPVGYGGFVPAMALVYISYVGFELITVASEEIIAPGKTIPRAILITLFVATGIYVFVVYVMMGTTRHENLAGSDVPFILMAGNILGGWGQSAAIVATIMASLSAFSVTLGASARVLYALGRDGHFPSTFARLHPRFRTPHIALAVCAAVVAAFAASGIVRFVASVSDFGYLMGLGVVNYAVFALHRRMPNLRRPFTVPLYPWVPLLGIVSCWMFVPFLEARSFALGGALTAAGAAIYLTRPENRRRAAAALPAARDRLTSWIRSLGREHMRVLIISGGRQGRNIADRLLAADDYRLVFRAAEHQITFVEEDEARCRELEQRYNVPVYQGDGTKQDLLEQVGPDNVDVTIAASEDDGRNVIAALQARRLGMGRVMAIVQDPEYVSLLEEQGILAISAPWATAAMVENYLDRPGVAELFEIGSGVASLVSVPVPETGPAAGALIRDMAIPNECVVAAVIRGDRFVVPRGDTRVEAGDYVVLVGPAEAVKKAQKMVAGEG
ncbi:MAG: amino acid permease [Candidatus Palauibacterales bacterium]|nr:amino acid permease [Candidatus Palauibacterales bacterium]MDP2528451.1 amino acid permease [Candidatus Palauibacterales bacterium]MDP2584460.1 amino acid permease [Candidatus Palauibacterales bacterium]